MGKKLKYRFTATAFSELEDILSYISIQLSNPDAADSLCRNIEKALEGACHYPQMYPVYKRDKLKFSVRRIAFRNYAVFYSVDEDRSVLVVEHIVSTKQNLTFIFG